MKKCFTIAALMIFFLTTHTHAQLSSHDVAKAITRGINMGNTFEAPYENYWGNPVVTASNFDDYKNAGFTCVRLPVTWDIHIAATPPYTIDATWISRIEQVVNWGLSRGLFIIINAHHEGWIKTDTAYANPNTRARFDSLWSQVATRFQNKSDSLLFEVINEPYPLSRAYVDNLNARIISIMRKTNPKRIILFSGYGWSNSYDLTAAAIPTDSLLIGYYHSYDPYPFGLNGTGTYGSTADINGTIQKFNQVSTWSSLHNVPVVLSEFGAMDTSKYNSRMCYYGTVTQQALAHNVPFEAWEDGGQFKFYNRTQHTWTDVKDILIHTYKESPNSLTISSSTNTSIKIQWHNNTTASDSIVIERKINLSDNFISFATVGPTTSVFIDTTTSAGTTYYYRLSVNIKDSIIAQSYPIMITAQLTTDVPAPENTPLHFQLSNNYPNPFNPVTTIPFQIQQRSYVTLKIYDLLGREVATIFSGELNAGNYTQQWNAEGFSSGVYFYRLTANNFSSMKKLVLLK
jgi:aryl-phospho-beta-D-glucosidase BglC (GH1 family)